MGLEQTPAHAERSALLHALLASSTARVPVRLLIDNLAVVKRLRRGLGLKTWLGDSLAFWHFIAGLCETGVEVDWIPSHDKLVSWEPSNNWGVDAATCRKLNAAADRAAAELTEQAFQNLVNNVALQLCIPQINLWVRAQTLQHVPVFVAHSSQMLVLWDDTACSVRLEDCLATALNDPEAWTRIATASAAAMRDARTAKWRFK